MYAPDDLDTGEMIMPPARAPGSAPPTQAVLQPWFLAKSPKRPAEASPECTGKRSKAHGKRLEQATSAPTLEYQYFSSGCGKCALSNFAAARVVFRGDAYPSSEHAYQANKFVEGDRHRFQEGGDLATFAAFSKFYPALHEPKKVKFWSAVWGGKRPPMVGIVAKMASHPDRAKLLGLTFAWQAETNEAELTELFKEILVAKFTQNPSSLAVLKATGDATLVEFGRGAAREEAMGRSPVWTGLVKDGKVVGGNLMGRIMEMVRAELTAVEA